MKNFLTSVVLTLLTCAALAQGSYTSQDNKTAAWETASIWTKQYSWMAAAPPGPSNVGGSYTANVNGYVTRNGNLTISGGALLNVYDTLVIKGNLTISSSMGVVIQPGGVLIVLGDFISTSSGGSKVVNNGNMVVTGDFSHSGGTIDTNSKVYSFDASPTFGWGSSVNGVNYNGNNTNGMANQLKSKSQLASSNPSLSGFVNGLLGVMPVKLIEFTASLNSNRVSLEWITTNESGFDHFEIERASSNLVFEKIGQVKGAGYNTSDEQTYSLTDATAAAGTNYYRLKSVDLDSTFEYSSIVSVTVAASKTISVYPNPSNGDFVNVITTGEVSDNTWVTVFNERGVLIQKTRVAENDARINFTNHLVSGVYILKYTSPGHEQIVRLFVR